MHWIIFYIVQDDNTKDRDAKIDEFIYVKRE